MAKVQGPGILNEWGCHIPGCAERYQEFYKYVIEEFDKKQIPAMTPYWEKVGSTFSRKKDFWAVDRDDNTCYICAEVLGIDLYVAWLIYNPRWQKELKKDMSTTRNMFWSMFGSDVGDMVEIACFAAVIKDCAVNAADRIFDIVGLDKGKMNRQSSGVLGPI